MKLHDKVSKDEIIKYKEELDSLPLSDVENAKKYANSVAGCLLRIVINYNYLEARMDSILNKYYVAPEKYNDFYEDFLSQHSLFDLKVKMIKNLCRRENIVVQKSEWDQFCVCTNKRNNFVHGQYAPKEDLKITDMKLYLEIKNGEKKDIIEEYNAFCRAFENVEKILDRVCKGIGMPVFNDFFPKG